MSRKSERLVNLTIALLATKRYLTKSEIFRTVDVYMGSAEAKERMFERDKDDLRNLGIEIEVGNFDPLFDDEAGYRIRPEKYELQLGELNNNQIALLSLAAQAWRGAALDTSALSALVKLKSIGIDSDLDSLPALAPQVTDADSELSVITHAIVTRTVISFAYLAESLEVQKRALEPYGVAARDGHWYVVGNDLDKRDIRVFRIDRIRDEVISHGKEKSFEIPQSFSVVEHLSPPAKIEIAIVQVRLGKAYSLRRNLTAISVGDEWETVHIPYSDEDSFLREILWHGDDVILIEPAQLRQRIIYTLTEIVEKHG